MEIRALSDAEIQDAENLFREIERRPETKETAVRHFPKAIRSSRFLGAYTADLAGFLAYTPDCFDIQYIGVRKEEAGKGVATALLKELAAIAERSGATRLTVCTRRSILPLFRSFGFEEEGASFEQDGILFVPMEYLLERRWLGRHVHVSVELSYGSYHPLYPDTLVTCNKGIVEESLSDETIMEAYVVGQNEPAERAEGRVIGIVYHRDTSVCRLLVAADVPLLKKQIIDSIAFEEQYADVRILWDERNVVFEQEGR